MIENHGNDRVNIFQITDTHLFEDDNQLMYGVNTNRNFYALIEKIQQYQKIKPDFFILTGDLSQDESEASYIKIVNTMKKFNLNVYWIPGNHDNVEKMESVFNKNPLFFRLKKLSLKNWEIVFLNTKMDGTDKGFLSQDELYVLESELKSSDPSKQIAIVMHHHPIKVNTPLIDKYILQNPTDFFDIVKTNSNIKLIICGHVHGDYQLKYENIYIESSPATCLQWKRGSSSLEIEKNMGFKVYSFYKENYSCLTQSWSFI